MSLEDINSIGYQKNMARPEKWMRAAKAMQRLLLMLKVVLSKPTRKRR